MSELDESVSTLQRDLIEGARAYLSVAAPAPLSELVRVLDTEYRVGNRAAVQRELLARCRAGELVYHQGNTTVTLP